MAGRAMPDGRMNLKCKETARGDLTANITE